MMDDNAMDPVSGDADEAVSGEGEEAVLDDEVEMGDEEEKDSW